MLELSFTFLTTPRLTILFISNNPLNYPFYVVLLFCHPWLDKSLTTLPFHPFLNNYPFYYVTAFFSNNPFNYSFWLPSNQLLFADSKSSVILNLMNPWSTLPFYPFLDNSFAFLTHPNWHTQLPYPFHHTLPPSWLPFSHSVHFMWLLCLNYSFLFWLTLSLAIWLLFFQTIHLAIHSNSPFLAATPILALPPILWLTTLWLSFCSFWLPHCFPKKINYPFLYRGIVYWLP